MSGPLTRMSDDVIDKATPILRKAAENIGAALAAPLRVSAAEIAHTG
jgi:DNA-binding IclR family transcriptional regulator